MQSQKNKCFNMSLKIACWLFDLLKLLNWFVFECILSPESFYKLKGSMNRFEKWKKYQFHFWEMVSESEILSGTKHILPVHTYFCKNTFMAFNCVCQQLTILDCCKKQIKASTGYSILMFCTINKWYIGGKHFVFFVAKTGFIMSHMKKLSIAMNKEHKGSSVYRIIYPFIRSL